MAIDLSENNEESNTKTLPIPVPVSWFERYRTLQNELHKRGKKPLHSFMRERMAALMNEVEAELKKTS